ncbi:MAG: hypothetical protein BCS36_05800 [Desulfovibrio sp. MES5]|nr:MAG: hypothetical protein BCS36_05800 [Desulfovibrio sp. MES5]
MRVAVFTKVLSLFLLCACLVLANARHAVGHALRAAEIPQEQAVVMQFAYSTGEVPAFANVEVYGPADAGMEFQNGRTDAQGRFAFVPNAPGQWRVIMADNMGHRVVHETTVAENGGAAPTADAAADAWGRFATPLRAFLGVSLLLNLGTMSVLWRQRRKA